MTEQFNYTDCRDTPESSWIEALYYNRDTAELAVVTEGRHYIYKDVPLETYLAGRRAESVGRWYNYNVQGVFNAADVQGSRALNDPIAYVEVDFPPLNSVRNDPHVFAGTVDASSLTIRGSNNYDMSGITRGDWPTFQPTNPEEDEQDSLPIRQYEISADVRVNYFVSATSAQDAINLWADNPLDYINIDVKGVQLVEDN